MIYIAHSYWAQHDKQVWERQTSDAVINRSMISTLQNYFGRNQKFIFGQIFLVADILVHR